MKKVLAAFLTILMMLLPLVSATLVTEQCLNDTHILIEYDYEIAEDGAVTAYNYTQIQQCTNNCSYNKCAGTDITADSSNMWLTYAVGTVFLLVGVLLGKPTDQEDFNKGFSVDLVLRYMFFFVGFYLLYLSLGLSVSIAHTYGSDNGTTSGIETSTMVVMLTMVVFLFFLIVGVIKQALLMINDTRRRM